MAVKQANPTVPTTYAALQLALQDLRDERTRLESERADLLRRFAYSERHRDADDLAALRERLAGVEARIDELNAELRTASTRYAFAHAEEIRSLWLAREAAEVQLLATELRLEGLLGREWRAKQTHTSPQRPGLGSTTRLKRAVTEEPYAWQAIRYFDDMIDFEATNRAIEEAERERERIAREGAERARLRGL